MKLKKLLVLTVAITTFFVSTLNVFAASGISAEEQQILNRLKAGITVNGVVKQVPAEYYNMAVTELTNNGADLTADQVNTIIGDIDSAQAVISSDANIKSLKDVRNSDKFSTIVAYANAAANVANTNLTSIIDVSGTVKIVDKAVGDGSGASATTTVAETGSIIKQTGVDLTQSAIVLISMAALMTACIFYANKKSLFVVSAKA